MSEAEHHRANDPPLLEVTRGIPLTWIINSVVSLVVAMLTWAVIQYIGQLKTADQVSDLKGVVGAMSKKFEETNGYVVELRVDMADARRRLDRLEKQKP